MYDAQQGSTSGAHIDLSTASAPMFFTARLTFHRGTSCSMPHPSSQSVIPTFRPITSSGVASLYTRRRRRRPIVKDKLFRIPWPTSICTSPTRKSATLCSRSYWPERRPSASALATLANNSFGTSLTDANIDHTALALFNSPSASGEPGKWLIPTRSQRHSAHRRAR